MIDLEREFGKDYKKKIRESLIKDFADDESTRNLFNQLCDELMKCDYSDDEIVEMIKILPSNIAFAVVRNLENRDEIKLISMLNEIYLEDFNNEFFTKGKVAIAQKVKHGKNDEELYLKERLLTRHEIDNAIKREAKRSGDTEIFKNLYVSFVYHGENDRLKMLFEIRSKIDTTSSKKKINEIIDKIKQPLMKNILNRINEKKTNIEV